MKRQKCLFLGLAAGAAALALAAAPARAASLYFQGFETDTSGWNISSPGSIAREASGTNGITAFDGGYYAALQSEGGDSYNGLSGYGSGGYSWFEGNGSTPPAYPGGPFSESISVYINTATPPPTDGNAQGFAIDMSPSMYSTPGGCGVASCADEQLFYLLYTGSSVKVQNLGPVTENYPVISSYTINSSGWYTFQTVFKKGATPTSIVKNDLDIFDAAGNLLSTTATTADEENLTLESSDLAGPGYVWLPQWDDTFDQMLAIDDVRADTLPTPEPSSLAVLGAGLIGLGFVARKHRRKAS